MRKSRLQLDTFGGTTLLFVIIALLFGLVFVKEVPLFWNLDESAHFSRAYQVSEGRFLAQKLPDSNYGDYVPADIVQLHVTVHQDLGALALGPVFHRHDLRHEARQKSIAKQSINQPKKAMFDFPGSAAYSPVAYIAPAAGILTCRVANCSLGDTILLARFFGLIAYVGVVAFSIWLLRTKKIRWLIFAVALLPIAIFQAAAVSADEPIIALSLLLFAILMKALSDKKLSPLLIVLLAVVAVYIPLIKSTYGLLDLSIVPVVMLIFKDKKKVLVYVAGSALIIAVLTLGWLHLARGPSKAISTLQASNPATHSFVSIRRQSSFVLHKPFGFVQTLTRTGMLDEPYWVYSTTGEFALNAVQIPLTAAVFAYIILVGSVFYARNELIRFRRSAVILGLVSVLTALGIFGTLYLTFTPVGSSMIAGVQGRYFVPLIPFFFVGVAAVIPARLLMSPKTAAILFSASSCVLLFSGVLYYGLATY